MNRSTLIAASLAAVIGTGSGYVIAQGMPQQHRMPGSPMMHGAQHGSTAGAERAPSSRAFAEAMDKMHRDMAIAYSGNADRDFAAGMIPHHQGAIDMARVVIEHGKDPEVRKLAQDIIAAQEREIAQMREMLARLPPS